jgi:hypothetical protein
MDRAGKKASGVLSAQWAAIVAAACACAAGAGCARMNPFLRDDPPMLGTVQPTATSASRTSARPGSKPSLTTGQPGGRPASTGDLYAQSFNRTKPKPTASAEPAAEEAESTEPAPTRAIARSEDAVRPTSLDATANRSNASGIILRPPVPMNPSRGVAPEGTAPSVEPAQPSAATAPVQAEPSGLAAVEAIVHGARQRLESLQSYQVAINRQERVGDVLQEPEDVLLSIRRSPRAVRLQWNEGPHRGREVIFSDKETSGMLQVNMADSKIPIPRLTLPPDSPLALRNSRHPITEAGFDTVLGNLTRTITENKAGDLSHGRINYGGMAQTDARDRPCHKITRVTAAGETWQIFIDPESNLPALVEANAASGDLLERYYFRNIQADLPELAAADAFDPNQRWGEAKGLLHRLAGARPPKDLEPTTTQ